MAIPSAADDRTCLVTGASSGIGREIARELARRGLGVTLVARREDRLAALADELSGKHGIRAEVLAADLTDAAERGHIGAELAARGLGVDVLVNNAGVGTFGPVQHSDPDGEAAMVRLDVEAVVDLCSRFVPAMVERGAGAVLNVASTAAYQPIPGQAAYAAAKAFVLSYSQAIRAELRGTGVTVTALCPGPVHTEFGSAAGVELEDAGQPLPKFMWVPAERVAAVGVEGLASGRAVVIPGLANRVTSVGGQLLPRSLLVPMIARQHPSLRE